MIVIVDYGMGNLRSVQKGFERIGHAATISADPATIAAAARVVLPGVGAFGDAMQELRSRCLIEPIQQVVAQEKPLLGICLGLQLLFERSNEGGEHAGLGILPGKVVRFENRSGYKVPHMGWNQLELRTPSQLLAGIPDEAHVYFVHAYYAQCADPATVIAETNYPAPFAAAVGRGRVYATQFHPEKSQATGLQILRNFAERC